MLDIFGASASSSDTGSATSNQNDDKTTHDIMSASDIQHRMRQHSIEIEWTGEKFEPKSFHVFKLTDVTDRLQVCHFVVTVTLCDQLSSSSLLA